MGRICNTFGSIFTWGGCNTFEQDVLTGHGEGFGVWLPRILQGLSSKGVVSMSTHDNHTACITKTGEVFIWGKGGYGKLGYGDENYQVTPKRVEALVGVKAKMVSCGANHTGTLLVGER